MMIQFELYVMSYISVHIWHLRMNKKYHYRQNCLRKVEETSLGAVNFSVTNRKNVISKQCCGLKEKCIAMITSQYVNNRLTRIR